MTDSERLKEVIEMFEMSSNSFGKYIGLKSSQSIYDVLKGRNGISKDLADSIVLKCPAINAGWLLTGEGERIKPGFAIQRGKNNVNVSGGTSGITGVMTGGTFVHNGGKDQVIEKQERQVEHMFEAFMVELRGFHEYILRQDDQIKLQDDHLKEIVKHSYLRNERNMERFDKLFEQQNRLIEMAVDQNRQTQSRADRLLDLLEKKI